MASALDAARAAIETKVDDDFIDAPVAWPGRAFQPPDGPWVRVTHLWGDGFALTVDGVNEVVGLLRISIFDKPNNGFGQIYDICDTLRDLFNRANISGVRFGTASGPKPESEPVEGWLQATLDVPLDIEESVTV